MNEDPLKISEARKILKDPEVIKALSAMARQRGKKGGSVMTEAKRVAIMENLRSANRARRKAKAAQ